MVAGIAALLVLLVPRPGDEVPADAPDDAVMAGPAEIAAFREWVLSAFAGEGARPSEGRESSDLLVRDGRPPFSFRLGGSPSSELMASWIRHVESGDAGSRRELRVRWSDPKTGFRVTADVAVYGRYPAADWILRFENAGSSDSPLLEDAQALDLRLAAGGADCVLHGINGDDCSERTFQPFVRPVAAGEPRRMAPAGGRPSNGAFPFFTIDCGGRGVVAAVGWSGQWAVSLERDASTVKLWAGMERIGLVLRPGESIRTPRILLMPWRGDRLDAHNRFRRLMLFHYAPRVGGRPILLPVFWQGYDRYRNHPRWGTEAGQIDAARAAAEAGAEVLWLDAAWFPGDFPNGVGNWTCKPKEFPAGLRPVSDACRRLGLKFIVWFEPERVAAGTEIAREHPEFVHGGSRGGLFRLDDPAARRWMADLLCRRIEEFGMDWYRNDFNIDPLPYWRRADAPGRLGMTEIRYVEGHYALWDELLERRPGLVIDNCASGGRRIDLETVMRSVPLWRSDTSCGPGRADWDQAQHMGLSLYIPLHLACGWSPEPYVFRSAAAAGAIAQFNFLDKDYSPEAARAALAEAKEHRKYSQCDFYPITAASTAPDRFVAWQLHRADLDAGLVLAFRRAACEIPEIAARLRGIRPESRYLVEFVDERRAVTSEELPGRELAGGLRLSIPERRASLAVRYRPAGR